MTPHYPQGTTSRGVFRAGADPARWPGRRRSRRSSESFANQILVLARALRSERPGGCEAARVVWRARGGTFLSADLLRLRRPIPLAGADDVEIVFTVARASEPTSVATAIRTLLPPSAGSLGTRRETDGSIRLYVTWPMGANRVAVL